MTTVKKDPHHLAQATGSGSAVIHFKAILGEVDPSAAYLDFLPKPSSFDSYVRITILREALNQGSVLLPSDNVQTYIKLGTSAWSADAGSVKCDWDESLGRATGTFELINSQTGETLSSGNFDVILTVKK
ncbi:hypothetical protein SOM46_21495 [Pseudomonas fluorescens]|uniref:hypothetical protein n=1 Tax=Pseudomonas fluorescens TaxID=294 RepID=UPI00177B23DB|nr:hypothetical protein [Pseudomonas fluorescens]MBD8239885.1 hypothetical protein [Pseudomonas fluorescens]MDY0897510.1 hypothetical protein [Pseudomonas fluorescens]